MKLENILKESYSERDKLNAEHKVAIPVIEQKSKSDLESLKLQFELLVKNA